MSNQDIITKAESELQADSGYHYNHHVLAEVVEGGLADGDRISVGGGIYVTLTGAEAVFSKVPNEPNPVEVEVNRVPRSELNQEMLDTLLKCKANSAAILAVRK
jgi:hypothetical protein